MARPDSLSEAATRIRKNLSYFKPLIILGRSFSERETLGILVVSTTVVIFLTSVGSLLISALMVGFALVCAHGAFRVPEDLFLDDQEPASAGLLSFLGGTASSAAVAARACLLDSNKQGSLEKNSQRNATFPNGFEALILDVCDETEVAELKLKVGDFEMHLKRNTGVSAAVSPAPSQSKSSVEKTTPFTNVSFRNSSKMAALEASGASGYVLVASPTVGSFRRNRTVKGKKQPPICKEGNVIREGQVIGYLDQFGTELPVKSDVAGEVLKLLFDDGGNTSTILLSFRLSFLNNLLVNFALTLRNI
ncbi:hypothetical protein SADUNF_Sadunf10G0139500 [Salix dunnii]|uniref:PRA1 family protein n=1 Tax=Salix dunnii TaxID=1413687 RepID=A0A835MYT7_9ROSI|nr:hypothetical protein SADUNF_Sadunf10G0139500 [Salix dunnii]